MDSFRNMDAKVAATRAQLDAQLDNAGLEAWHDHLDACEQCRNHPWSLCEEGGMLLQLAVVLGRDLVHPIDVAGRPVSIDYRVRCSWCRRWLPRVRWHGAAAFCCLDHRSEAAFRARGVYGKTISGAV